MVMIRLVSFLPSFEGIIWECTLNSHSSQKYNLYCTRKSFQICSRDYIFYAILWYMFVLMEQINFTDIFFYMLHLLLLGKTLKLCIAGEKLCLWSPTFIFFSISTYRLYLLCRLFVFVKGFYWSRFSEIFSQNLKKQMKIVIHTGLDIALWENFFAF